MLDAPKAGRHPDLAQRDRRQRRGPTARAPCSTGDVLPADDAFEKAAAKPPSAAANIADAATDVRQAAATPRLRHAHDNHRRAASGSPPATALAVWVTRSVVRPVQVRSASA